ncbi:MAG: hypothetical protein K2M19_02610, partial [Muribaculaceae bacterium]|nr:hypothetical protein [Muribaculaceae bacterium]
RFELVVGLLLRQFSKLVVSATHPPLRVGFVVQRYGVFFDYANISESLFVFFIRQSSMKDYSKERVEGKLNFKVVQAKIFGICLLNIDLF